MFSNYIGNFILSRFYVPVYCSRKLLPEQTTVWYFWQECLTANYTSEEHKPLFQTRATDGNSFTQEVISREFHPPHTSVNLVRFPYDLVNTLRSPPRARAVDVQVGGPSPIVHWLQRIPASDLCCVVFENFTLMYRRVCEDCVGHKNMTSQTKILC